MVDSYRRRRAYVHIDGRRDEMYDYRHNEHTASNRATMESVCEKRRRVYIGVA